MNRDRDFIPDLRGLLQKGPKINIKPAAAMWRSSAIMLLIQTKYLQSCTVAVVAAADRLQSNSGEF